MLVPRKAKQQIKDNIWRLNHNDAQRVDNQLYDLSQQIVNLTKRTIEAERRFVNDSLSTYYLFLSHSLNMSAEEIEEAVSEQRRKRIKVVEDNDD